MKWIEDRREHLITANHSRQQLHRIRAGVDRDGRILAIDDEYFHDQGGYVRTHATRVVHMTAGILPGPYRVPAYRSVGHFRLTNKTPAATYRAPGRYETTFVRERLVDAIAQKLGIDPNDVRRRNAITKEEMPYHRPLEALGEEIEHDSGDYCGLLDRVIAETGWEKIKADVARRRAAGELVGAGLAMFVEKGGLGPADGVRIEVDTHGMIELITGGASLGQGFETVMAQVCAEGIGVDYKQHPRHPRPDRPHRVRHRRPRLARHRDDGVGDPQRRAEAARQGAGDGGRADAAAARRARHRRRPGDPQGSAVGAVDDARRDRQASGADVEDARRPRARACRSTAGSSPSTRSIPTASTSRWCGSTARPAA